MPENTHLWKMFITPKEITSALKEQGLAVQDIQGGKIAKNPIATLWEVWQQKRGRINFAELGRQLALKLDADLALNYLGFARKESGLYYAD